MSKRLSHSRKKTPPSRIWWPGLLLLMGMAGAALLAALVVPPGPVPEESVDVPVFTLTNQEGRTITNRTFAGHFYVTDFFFASCPSVCPRMQQQMARVYQRYRNNSDVLLLSHTIDPAHDSVPVLRDYARQLGVPTARQWHFATAPPDTVFALARAYITTAPHAASGPGSLVHSGTLALVDPRGHIVGLYDGLNPTAVSRLLLELDEFLAEYSRSYSHPDEQAGT